MQGNGRISQAQPGGAAAVGGHPTGPEPPAPPSRTMSRILADLAAEDQETERQARAARHPARPIPAVEQDPPPRPTPPARQTRLAWLPDEPAPSSETIPPPPARVRQRRAPTPRPAAKPRDGAPHPRPPIGRVVLLVSLIGAAALAGYTAGQWDRLGWSESAGPVADIAEEGSPLAPPAPNPPPSTAVPAPTLVPAPTPPAETTVVSVPVQEPPGPPPLPPAAPQQAPEPPPPATPTLTPAAPLPSPAAPAQQSPGVKPLAPATARPLSGVRVVVHYPGQSAQGRALAQATARELADQGAPDPELRGVALAVRRPAVRFFHSADQVAAALVEAAASRVPGVDDPVIQDFRHFQPKPRLGTVEVWVRPAE